MDPEKTPATPAPNDETIGKLADVLFAKLGPSITQTTEQAINSQANIARDLAAAQKTTEAKDAVIKDLQAKLEKSDEDLKLARELAIPQRRSDYTMREATELMADDLKLRPTTKGFYGRLGADAALGSDTFQRKYGQGATPLSVLMRGAIVPTYGTHRNFKVASAGQHDESLAEAQKLADGMFVWECATNRPRSECPVYPQYKAAMATLQKALDTVDGSEWVPTGFSARLLERYDLRRKIVPLMQTYQVQRWPEDVNYVGTMPTAYVISEQTGEPENATAVTAADIDPGKATARRVKIGSRINRSYEVDADSIINLGTEIVMEQGKSIAYWEELFMVSGDTTSPHRDVNVTNAQDVRKARKGWRFLAIDNSYTTSISAHTYESYTGMIGSMAEYGAGYEDLFWVIPPTIRAKLLSLKDSNNNPVWYGAAVANTVPGAQIIADAPLVCGIPVAVCQGFPINLNATGFYDGTTTSKTGVLLVNRMGYYLAYKNLAPVTESQKWIRTQQFEVVTSVERDFIPTYAIASNKTVWYGYGVTS